MTAADVVHDFALAVMKPGTLARLIDKHNESPGTGRLEDVATLITQAFCVEVDHDVLAVDADRPKVEASSDRNLPERLLKLAELLRTDGHVPVIVRSGWRDSLHLFCRIYDVDALRCFKAEAKALSLDVRERNKLIRPPLSPHRWGPDYGPQLIEPDNIAEALAALRPPRLPDLAPEWLEFLRDGVPKPADRSKKLQGLALAAVRAGWTCSQYVGAVLSQPNGAGAKLRDRSDATRYLERCWRQAVDYAKGHPAVENRPDVMAYVAKLRSRANKWRWPVRSARVYRFVLEAHLTIVESTGRIVHGASVRQVAAIAKVGLPAVVRAHRFLVQEGWLTLHKGSPKWTAESALWRVTMPTAASLTEETMLRQCGLGRLCALPRALPEQSLPQGVSKTVPIQHAPGYTRSKGAPDQECSDPAHDVWCSRWGKVRGLGGQAQTVYAALDPLAVRLMDELVVLLGVSAGRVQRVLRVLKGHGLAVLSGPGWLRGPADLDAVAEALGVAGYGEALRAAYRKQQESFKNEIERGGHLGRLRKRNPR